jgi:type IV secretion system protein VirB10
VAGAARRSRWKTFGVLLLAATSLVGIAWLTMQAGQPKTKTVTSDKAGEVGNDFVPIQRRPPVPTPVSLPGVVPTPVAVQSPGFNLGLGGPVKPAQTVAFQATYGAAAKGAQGSAAPAAVSGGQAGTGDPLDERLQAGADPDTAVATRLPDRNLFLTMGTPIGCTAEQPIRTDVPGPFRCKVTTPVYGTSGNVPLVDAGSWLFGTVSQPVGRGMSRAFAAVKRLETPTGCLVKLRAPVGDQMGTAGIDGEIDTHFWQRFEGYAMVALLDTVSQTAALAAANALAGSGGRNGNSLSFNQFQGMGQKLGQDTFASDVNIPPTLSTPQARNLVVMAMQDIDMRPCFTLRSTGVR